MGSGQSRPVRRVRAHNRPNNSAKSPAKSPAKSHAKSPAERLAGFRSVAVNAKRPRGTVKGSSSGSNHRNYRSPPNPNVYLSRLRLKLPQDLGLSPENAEGLLDLDRELINEFRNPRNLTLAKIDEFIGRHYDLMDEDRATRVVGNSRRKMEAFNGTDSFEVMHSSANNLDCLFHSFLTASCPNFRKCRQHDKDEFANFFRRVIFLTLPVVQAYAVAQPHTYNQMLQRIMGRDFLEELEVKLLAAQFHIRLLFLVNDDGDSAQEFIDAHVLSIEIPSVNADTDDSGWPIICLFTDMTHYECVRVDGRYILTLDDVAVEAHPGNNFNFEYNAKLFGPNVVPNNTTNMVGTRRARGNPALALRSPALDSNSIGIVLKRSATNKNKDPISRSDLISRGSYIITTYSGRTIQTQFNVNRQNDRIKFNLFTATPSIAMLNLKRNSGVPKQVFYVTLAEYRNFLDNILNKNREWTVQGENNKKIKIPGRWETDA
jgi:hypothetical protein